jgi:hypothetical protein
MSVTVETTKKRIVPAGSDQLGAAHVSQTRSAN